MVHSTLRMGARTATELERPLPSERKKLKNRMRKRISRRKRRQVYARDNFICQLCGNKCFPEDISLDHLVPVSKGGTNDKKNLITAHKSCNERKADAVYVRPPRMTTRRRLLSIEDVQEMTAKGLD